jgi:hypothetical protein
MIKAIRALVHDAATVKEASDLFNENKAASIAA